MQTGWRSMQLFGVRNIKRMKPKQCNKVDSKFSPHLKLRANGHNSQHCQQLLVQQILDGDGSANGRYNSQQSMDVQCIQGWIRPIRRRKLTKFGCHFVFNMNRALVRKHLAVTTKNPRERLERWLRNEKRRVNSTTSCKSWWHTEENTKTWCTSVAPTILEKQC